MAETRELKYLIGSALKCPEGLSGLEKRVDIRTGEVGIDVEERDYINIKRSRASRQTKKRLASMIISKNKARNP